jgi:adenylate kinase
MKLIFLGAPGAGKGTIAKIISKEKKIPHISTGDIFRKEMELKTPLGLKITKGMNEGKFVSDEVTIEIIKKRLNEKDCKNGFILDGFPRNLNQAEALDKITKIDAVVDSVLDEETLVHRLSGRRFCPKCKRDYNLIVEILLPKNDEICDVCKIKLEQRPDDKETILRKRLKIYEKETKPLIKYYEGKSILKVVTNVGDPNLVVEKVYEMLNWK